MAEFVDRLKELQGSYTQKEYAKRLQIPLNTYTNWLLRSNRPTIDAIISIAKLEGVSCDWLLGLSDIKTPCSVSEGVPGAIPPSVARDIERLRADAAQVCIRSDSFIAAVDNLKETLQRFSPSKTASL